MKRLLFVMVLAVAGCAESIPEISYVNGQTVMMQFRATPENNWELLIDGEIVVQQKTTVFSSNETLTGTYKGDPVMVRRYYRSNGWVLTHVADVFVGGQLVETLVIQ